MVRACAAAVDYPEAFAGLGRLHQEGLGVAVSRARAAQNYEKGAGLGDAQSQLRLASLDLAPPVTMQSTETALRWLRPPRIRTIRMDTTGYAWVLATSRFASCATALRPWPRQSAPASSRGRDQLDTLAAAYAESGDFDKAVAMQRDAIAALSNDERARELQAHLDRYQKQMPGASSRPLPPTLACSAFLVQHVRFFTRPTSDYRSPTHRHRAARLQGTGSRQGRRRIARRHQRAVTRTRRADGHVGGARRIVRSRSGWRNRHRRADGRVASRRTAPHERRAPPDVDSRRVMAAAPDSV